MKIAIFASLLMIAGMTGLVVISIMSQHTVKLITLSEVK